MAETDERYDRQLRLVEIGSTGQARIAAQEARVAHGPSAGVALAYLVRAGVGRLSIERRASAPTFRHAEAFQFAGPSAVAAGAHTALEALREAVFGPAKRETLP